MNDTYSFPVNLKPIETVGKEITGKKAVYREDTGEVLGIISDKYQILKHEDVVNGFREALDGQDYSENIQTTKKGSYLFANYRLNGIQGEVKKGDMVALQLTVKNSYDGANSLQISLGAVRLVCTNGMTISKKFFGYSVRHIGSNVGINYQALSEKLWTLADQFKNSLPAMKRMAETSVSGEHLFDSSEIRLPKYLAKEAEQEFQKSNDQTVWGYYNSLTYAITYKMKKQSPQMAIEYGRIAWELAKSLT